MWEAQAGKRMSVVVISRYLSIAQGSFIHPIVQVHSIDLIVQVNTVETIVLLAKIKACNSASEANDDLYTNTVT